MNKIKIKFFVDVVILVSFIVTSISAFLGRNGREIHEISGKIFIIVVIVHFILNWEMFVATGRNLFKKNENGIKIKNK